MTEEQEAQLRTIFEIEGFTPFEIEATFANMVLHPTEETKWVEFLSEWKLVSETKQ